MVERNRAQVSENPSDTVLRGSCTLQKMDLEFILLCEERQCEMKIHFILSWESFAGWRLRPKDIRSQDKEGGRGGFDEKTRKGVEYRFLLAYFLEHQPVALRQPKGLKFVFLLFRRSPTVSIETISGSKAIFFL